MSRKKKLVEPQTLPLVGKPIQEKRKVDLEGLTCTHVTFHSPVPRGKNWQPVNEFCLEGRDAKYIVDSLAYTPQGLVFVALGETKIVPLANVIVARLV